MAGEFPPTERQAAAPSDTVAGRYVVGLELGSGGFGRVHEAIDTVTGERVALKRFHTVDVHETARVRREIAALRLLRSAGVVRLLDDGEEAGSLFIVMELVAGTPFPGRPKPCTWEELAPVVTALLGTLAEVHDAGVLHRDLKPSNILVDAQGMPTLLDFGLARGVGLGPTITATGTAIGTPQYLAPEQAFGLPTDARADLWAVGALIYEALTGAAPHVEGGAESGVAPLLVRRATQPAPSIRSLLPDLAEGVATTVDALLAHRADDRPTTARDALRLLGYERPVAASALPELRPRALAGAISVVLDQRRGLQTVGPYGAGHTHLLDALVKEARRRGMVAVRTVSGRAPFASLEPVVGDLEERPNAGIEEMVAFCGAAVREALARGRVLVVDDSALLDPWSQRVLTSLGGELPVVCARAEVAPSPRGAREDGPAGVARRGTGAASSRLPGAPAGYQQLPLRPLVAADLEVVFDGPDRILHLREDAARELHRRSRGLPRAAAREIARWLRVGLAERGPTGIRLTRSSIERLASDSYTAVRVQEGGRVERGRGRGSVELSSLVDRSSHLRDLARAVLLAGSAATREVVARAWPGARWRFEAALDELEQLGVVTTQPDGTLTLDGLFAGHLDLDPVARRQTHGRIADALERQDPRRIVHLVAAERIDEVAHAALVISDHLERSGHQERALAVVVDALGISRASGDTRGASRLARRMALLALVDGNEMALQQAEYELQPSRTQGMSEGDVALARQLIEAALRGTRVGAAGGVPEVEVPSRYDDPRLAAWMWTLRVRAARAEPIERERAVVAEACRWARAVGGATELAHERTWLARLAYRERRWGHAAELNTLVAGQRTLPYVSRLAARTNAASALMEIGRFDAAVRMAQEAAADAATCRHAYYELRAWWIARTAAFRRGDVLEPDPELPALAARVGVPYLEVVLHLTEAAICWRLGAREAMAEHARAASEGATRLHMTVVEALARPLAWVATGGVSLERATGLFERVKGWPDPGLRLQGVALLATAVGRLGDDWAEVARAAHAETSVASRRWRLEAMSPDEGLAVVESVRRADPGGLPAFIRGLGERWVGGAA